MKYISEHAQIQAKARYNKTFDISFLDYVLKYGIKQSAINRKGHVVNNPNRGIYRCIYNSEIIECVISHHTNGDIVLVTFNTPPENIDDICYSYKEKAT